MQRWYSRPLRVWFRARISLLMAEEEDHLAEEEPQNPCSRFHRGLVRYWSSETPAVRKDRRYWENLPLEEKRKQYKCREYKTLSDIKTWAEFVPTDEPSPKKQAMDEEDVLYRHDPELNGKVSLWRGDITSLEIDAIVNAANRTLLGGGGVDGAIHAAAGVSLKDECAELDGCDTGDAKITSGHRLPAKYVIHTVGPIYSGRLESCASHLTSCYERSLQLALENNIRSIAFPCISTGVYRFPNDKAAEIALETTRKWLTDNLDKMDRIIFCVFLREDNSIYSELLQKYFPLDPVALVRNTETPDKTPSPPPAAAAAAEVVPTLTKSVTEPAPASTMFQKHDETKVKELDDSKEKEEEQGEELKDQEMDDNNSKKEKEEGTLQEQEMDKTEKDSPPANQEEHMEEQELGQ